MGLFKKVLREPLVHFLFIGAAVFGLYGLAERPEPAPRDRIVVSEGRVRQLAEVFARTWQRPPSAEELRGLIESYVRDEVYYREAVKLGLDRDDSVIRRRMRQKMEFLIEPSEEKLGASDAELEEFLAANRESFRREPRVAFEQVFINPAKAEQPAALRAASTLQDLKHAPSEQAGRLHGDPSLLPYEMTLSPLSFIARSFGEEFAGRLVELPRGEWSGPIASPFGLHLVRVTARKDGYDPPLAEVRKAVLGEWQRKKRERFAEDSYRLLREQYEVILPAPAAESEAAK